MLVAQKNSSQENPKVKDLYEVGSVSTILQLIKLPDGTYKVLVEGIKRAKSSKSHPDVRRHCGTFRIFRNLFFFISAMNFFNTIIAMTG